MYLFLSLSLAEYTLRVRSFKREEEMPAARYVRDRKTRAGKLGSSPTTRSRAFVSYDDRC